MNIGSIEINIPEGMEVFSLCSNKNDIVLNFIKNSPDYTIYHSPAYIEFTQKENGYGDIIALGLKNKIYVAIPFHRRPKGFSAGFSGCIFPKMFDEKTMLQTLKILKNFLDKNNHLKHIDVLQAYQSPGSMDSYRSTLTDFLYTNLSNLTTSNKIFTRIKQLNSKNSFPDKSNSSGLLSLAEMGEDLLKSYEHKKRSEIRLAEKLGLKVEYFIIKETDMDFIKLAYAQYLRLHSLSWQRTGLKAHSNDYWYRLSYAIAHGGGTDLIVVVSDHLSQPIAGVTCHLNQDFAIYCSSCSHPEALKKQANSLALHSAIWLSESLGVKKFELGRFSLNDNEKEKKITHYKAQFGGDIAVMPSLKIEKFDFVYSLQKYLKNIARSMGIKKLWILISIFYNSLKERRLNFKLTTSLHS